MFFKPKKEIQPEQVSPAQVPQGYSDVYVMPEKYVVRTRQGSNKGLLIASIILIAVILLMASYFIYDMMNRQPAAEAPAVTPPQIEIAQPETTTEQTLLATTTPETASTTATTTPTSTPAAVPPAIVPAKDTDNDGLTDVEEIVYGTLPTNPDTDGDGYKDGVEVAAGYNPTKAGSSRLTESPFMISLSTSFDSDNFKLLYPKDWQVSLVKAGKQAVITAATGEIIRVSVKENMLGQSVLAWYLQDHPEAMVSQLRIAEAGTLSGIFSPSGLIAYLTDATKSKFYIFEYLVGQQTEYRYLTSFGAIIKSIAPIVAASGTPPAASSTPSAAVCLGYLCAEEPCGPLVSGQNSCLSPTLKTTCYEKVCATDDECPAGEVCAEISCWSGDTAEIAKVCK